MTIKMILIPSQSGSVGKLWNVLRTTSTKTVPMKNANIILQVPPWPVSPLSNLASDFCLRVSSEINAMKKDRTSSQPNPWANTPPEKEEQRITSGLCTFGRCWKMRCEGLQLMVAVCWRQVRKWWCLFALVILLARKAESQRIKERQPNDYWGPDSLLRCPQDKTGRLQWRPVSWWSWSITWLEGDLHSTRSVWMRTIVHFKSTPNGDWSWRKNSCSTRVVLTLYLPRLPAPHALRPTILKLEQKAWTCVWRQVSHTRCLLVKIHGSLKKPGRATNHSAPMRWFQAGSFVVPLAYGNNPGKGDLERV